MSHAVKISERFVYICAFLLFGFLILRSFLQFDRTTGDFLYYHLPFALKAYGLTTYEMSDWLNLLYDAYPPLAHRLQGLLVLITGKMQMANTLGAMALLGLVCTVWRGERNGKAVGFLIVALLAVPMILFHIPAGCLDLWLGSFLALSFYCTMKWEKGGEFSWLCRAGIFLTIACLSKYQAWPVAMGLVTFILFHAFFRHKERKVRIAAILIAFGCALWPLHNAIRYGGNPCYPYPPPLVGKFFPQHVQMATLHRDFTADWVKAEPPPLRFLVSLFELSRLQSGPEMVWGDAGWQPGGNANPHYYLGGYSYLTMILLAIGFVAGVGSGWVPGGTLAAFLAAVGIIAFLPQNHELRYWLFLPIFLAMVTAGWITVASSRSRALPVLLQIGFIASAAFTLWKVNPFSLDMRPPLATAPPEAIAFWEKAATEPPNKVTDIQVEGPKALYYTGPKFNSYRVFLKQ